MGNSCRSALFITLLDDLTVVKLCSRLIAFPALLVSKYSNIVMYCIWLVVRHTVLDGL